MTQLQKKRTKRVCVHIYRKTDRSLRILFIIRNRCSKEPADKCLLECMKIYIEYCDYEGVDSYTTLTEGWLTHRERDIADRMNLRRNREHCPAL